MLSLSWDKVLYQKMLTNKGSALTPGNPTGSSQSPVLQLAISTQEKAFHVSVKQRKGNEEKSFMQIKKEPQLFPSPGDKRG